MLSDKISDLKPCRDAVVWLDQQQSPQQAWDDCPRGDWMLWLIGKQIKSESWSDGRKSLLACALDCAGTVKHRWSNQTVAAVTILRSWIAGEATVKEARSAKQELCDADAADAAYAAYAAADAAYAAADAAARTQNWLRTANIVRQHFPISPIL